MAGQPHLAKAQAALALLVRADTGSVRLSVVNSDAVGAYSWPGGEIVVTRGLVDLLNQKELAAAIAHEMGHLVADNTLNPPSSLHGVSSGNSAEISADAIGAKLLQKQRIERGVMISMLRKVSCCPSVDPTCRKAMLERIQILSQ